ncbi:lytic transglycosylase domain-containing protein, partial [Acetobacter sacchari]|nr:lytic transglycosylase domain-containing protein [Acetobacter sacchari]
MADDLERHYERAGEYWGVDPNVLRAVHMVEDPGGDPDARSRSGAIGHMQFMPDTARAVGIDPHDPVQSIYGGARVLRENLDRYGNLPDALRAYNAGTDKNRWGNPETMAYPQKVADQYAGLQRGGDDPFAGAGTSALPSNRESDQSGNAFDSMFGKSGDAAPQSSASSADPFASVFGHEVDSALPARAHAHQGSWAGNLAQFGADAVDAAGRELSKPVIFAESHIPGVAKALKGTGYAPDEWRDLNKFREQEQAGDWGAGASRFGGALLGDSLVAGGVSKLLPAAKGGMLALAGRRAAEGAATAELTDQNPLAGAALGAASVPVGVVASKVGGKLTGRGGNALMPSAASSSGSASSAPAAQATPISTSAPSASAGQAPPESVRLGLFTSPKDADKLAARIWQDYQNGGPAALVQSKIPGVHLTASQATGNAGLAQLERVRRAANPSPFTALEQANAEARNAYAQKVIGTEDQL